MIVVGKIIGKKPSIRKLKGQIINGFLVVEDVFYAEQPKGRRHKCICKCVVCGSIRRMEARKLKNDEKPCSCNLATHKRVKFRKLRGKLLKTLNEEINILKREALFEDDYRRLANLKEVCNFICSESLNKFFINVESVERARKLWKKRQVLQKQS